MRKSSLLAYACAGVILIAQSPTGVAVSYIGEGANKDGVRIDLIRWSTDQERDQIFNAWTNPASAVSARPGADTTDPFGTFRRAGAAKQDDPAASARSPGGGRGKGKDAPPAVKKTPTQTLSETIAKLPTVGYVWTSEVAGYAVKYAVRVPQPEGGEHLLILTGRPLADSTDPFSVIELHLPAKGLGEGKTGKLSAKSLDMENYTTLPISLRSVRKK